MRPLCLHRRRLGAHPNFPPQHSRPGSNSFPFSHLPPGRPHVISVLFNFKMRTQSSCAVFLPEFRLAAPSCSSWLAPSGDQKTPRADGGHLPGSPVPPGIPCTLQMNQGGVKTPLISPPGPTAIRASQLAAIRLSRRWINTRCRSGRAEVQSALGQSSDTSQVFLLSSPSPGRASLIPGAAAAPWPHTPVGTAGAAPAQGTAFAGINLQNWNQ